MKTESTRRVEPTTVLLTCTTFAMAICVGIASAATPGGDKPIVFRAGTLHVGNGETIVNGAVLVVGGRIQAVGANLKVPAGATVIELDSGAITPGLIDANAAVEPTDAPLVGSPRNSARDAAHALEHFFCPKHQHTMKTGCCGSICSRALSHVSGEKCSECGFPDAAPKLSVGTRRGISLAEQSSEIIPHTRVLDCVNLRSPDFDRLLADGVTTVFVAPDSAAVISSQGAIVHTGGPLAERVIRDVHAVKATMGTDPSWRGRRNDMPFRDQVTFYARRPNTRMGVAWVFRKAMYDTQKAGKGLEVSGADTPSPAAMNVLRKVLNREIPLRIRARMQHDILAAFRLAEEFDLPFILEEGTEAHRCIEELKAHGTPVVYGPIYVSAPGERAYSGEVSRARLHTMKALLDAGIETALSAHELRDEDGLSRQAMYAIRFGIPLDSALRSVTQTPAKLLGLDGELGTLIEGKQADIVLWNTSTGSPFEATSKPVVVMINGRIVLDRRDG